MAAWDMAEAQQRWLTAMQEQKRRRLHGRRSALAPWDENVYFDLPKFTTVQLAGFPATATLCQANPSRVILIISPDTGIIKIMTDTDTTQVGLTVQSTTSLVIFTQAEHGPLCAAGWFASSQQPVKVQVAEVILREWPAK